MIENWFFTHSTKWWNFCNTHTILYTLKTREMVLRVGRPFWLPVKWKWYTAEVIEIRDKRHKLGLKGLGLKLGVEKSGVEMSFNRCRYTCALDGLIQDPKWEGSVMSFTAWIYTMVPEKSPNLLPMFHNVLFFKLLSKNLWYIISLSIKVCKVQNISYEN